MDWPGALAVKLNIKDRKGSGAHPGYGLKLSPATDGTSQCPHRTGRSVQSGCWPRAVLTWPQGPVSPQPQPGGDTAGRTQAEEDTGTGTASSFPIIWGRSEGTPGASVGQSHPESHQLGSWGEPAQGQQQQQAVVGAGGAAAVVSVVWSPTGRWRGEFLVFQCAGLM